MQKKQENKFKPRFVVGDKIRIYAWRNDFHKSYTGNWTKELFKVKNVYNSYPPTYSIVDLKGEEIIGRFYNQELLKSSAN